MDFKKKQKSQIEIKDFLIRAAAFLVIVAVVILIVADFKIWRQRKSLEAEILNYNNKISQLKERNKKLEEAIANSDNPDYIEKIAREEQGMQKEGETAVSFVMPDNSQQNNFTATNTSAYSQWIGWLSGSWNWIKGLF